MKNLCKIIIILLITNLGFAQNTGKKGTYGLAGGTIGKKQETPKNSVSKTETNFTNSCYKNFAFSLKNYGYNKDGKFYSWGIKVKNNYNQAVQLKYKLIVGNDNNGNGTLTYYIKPGETYANDYGKAKAVIVDNNSDKYKIEVTEVCFEGQDCIHNGYVECNGKQKLISNTENSTTNSISEHNKKFSNVNTTPNRKKGEYYQYGLEGYPKDFSQAIIYYEKAINEGDEYTPHILVTLGYMYKEGEGVAQNNQIALDYFKKACDMDGKTGCTAFIQLNLKLKN
jgi:TPR repeat protein